jgi:N5-(cytidine 5'-diphosphoramidyl)-L-glutamine hydrolase
MKKVAISQRVLVLSQYGERRDCLDQAWPRFLATCGLMPIALPNVLDVAITLCEATDVCGLVLTGGNDLSVLGGDAPERDSVECALLDFAERKGLPVLGVCRGMQVIQQRFSIPLHSVESHIAERQMIRIEGEPAEVNSYHRFAALDSRPPLDAWAIANDGVIEAVRHASLPMTGIMWHPERRSPFAAADVALFRRTFAVE